KTHHPAIAADLLTCRAATSDLLRACRGRAYKESHTEHQTWACQPMYPHLDLPAFGTSGCQTRGRSKLFSVRALSPKGDALGSVALQSSMSRGRSSGGDPCVLARGHRAVGPERWAGARPAREPAVIHGDFAPHEEIVDAQEQRQGRTARERALDQRRARTVASLERRPMQDPFRSPRWGNGRRLPRWHHGFA